MLSNFLNFSILAAENFEVSMHRKDGSIHWISINARTIYDDQGKVLYYEGTMQDITKRKMAEEALGESEERYRTAIEHSNDAVAIIEGDKNQFVNKRFLEMFEFESADEIIGRSISTIVHPGDRDMVVEMNRKRQKGEEVPSCYEFKGITNKGRILFVEVSATTITYRGKNFYLVLLRDITERKQAEEALRTERNRFQTLSENAPFGISLIGKDGVFTYINPKFTELFGYDLNDFPNGRGWFRKAYPDRGYRREVINAWISDLRNTRVGQKMPRTFVVTCKDGSEKTINFIPVRLPTGEHIITYEDITDRIKAQESLLKSHQELERLNRAKTKAVNHISHELRTPLAVIQGNMRVLRNKINNANLTDTFSGILDTMERHLKRLFRISKETDEIFLVSQELEAAIVLDELDRLWQRIENFPAIPPDIRLHWDALRGWLNKFLSGSEQSFQSVDIYPFVTAVVEKARSRAAHRDLHIDVEGEHDLFVFTDPYILTEVLASLIKNAIENTPDGGRIQIALEPKGDKIWIHVTDHGIGITEENRQYIFDGLFHTRATELYASKNPYDFGAGGKGFELLLIKAYAQRFGFEITMTSNRCAYIPTDQDACPGKIEDCPHCRSVEDCLRSGGSTFSVGLPAGNNISTSIH